MAEVSRRDFIKASTAIGGGLIGFLGLRSLFRWIGNSQRQSEINKQNEILAHQAKVLETDNKLGVEKAIVSFQVECKNVPLSIFVLTEKGENGFPKIFTELGGKTVELGVTRNGNEPSWFIPEGDQSEGPSGQEVLAYKMKPDESGKHIVHYFPPYGGKAEQIKFDREKEMGFTAKASELPQKVQELLFA